MNKLLLLSISVLTLTGCDDSFQLFGPRHKKSDKTLRPVSARVKQVDKFYNNLKKSYDDVLALMESGTSNEKLVSFVVAHVPKKSVHTSKTAGETIEIQASATPVKYYVATLKSRIKRAEKMARKSRARDSNIALADNIEAYAQRLKVLGAKIAVFVEL